MGNLGYRPGNHGFQYQNFGRVNAIESDTNLDHNCEGQTEYHGYESEMTPAYGYDPSSEQTGYDHYQETDPTYGYGQTPQDYNQSTQEHHHQQEHQQQESQQEQEKEPLDSFYTGVKRITLVEDDI